MEYFIILLIVLVGYAAIIFESVSKVNKAAVALFMAGGCWAAYFFYSPLSLKENLDLFRHHTSNAAQVIFFLMGAMAIVELIDSHRGFSFITSFIKTRSRRKMLWIVSLLAFFLSSLLDNLTTTILMISLLRKLIPDRKEKFLLFCLVVVAANAGGAWTPIGDVTTTMLWIEGQLSTLPVMQKLFIPSLVSLLVPLVYYTFKIRGKFQLTALPSVEVAKEPGALFVLILGLLGLVFVPVFKAVTGLPPFMGVLISLSVLWLITDGMHHSFEHRKHLRVPYILSKIDISAVLFFLGILLCVSALESAHILKDLADWLTSRVDSLPLLSTSIGLLSAIVDNVPLVAATMGMYPLSQFPPDHNLWLMIAYAAGTGGSILIIGSSSGVALMGMEKVDFIEYMKTASLPTLIGYLAGMGVYILFS